MDITKISPRPPGLAGALRARKSVDAIVARNDQEPGHGLKRSMGLVHLTALSIGASLGTGIFVILGEATPMAGPAVVLAFVLAGVHRPLLRPLLRGTRRQHPRLR